MHEHEDTASTDTAPAGEHPHSGGGQRYQEAHRQHDVDHGGARWAARLVAPRKSMRIGRHRSRTETPTNGRRHAGAAASR